MATFPKILPQNKSSDSEKNHMETCIEQPKESLFKPHKLHIFHAIIMLAMHSYS